MCIRDRLKGSLRNQRLEDLRWEKRTIILYESPHRIKHTLADLLKVLGDRPAVLARELTKKFEEFQRGTLAEILRWSERVQVRGELTLMIAGTQEKVPLQVVAAEQYTLPEEEVMFLLSQGTIRNQAIKEVAKKWGDVYKRQGNV